MYLSLSGLGTYTAGGDMTHAAVAAHAGVHNSMGGTGAGKGLIFMACAAATSVGIFMILRMLPILWTSTGQTRKSSPKLSAGNMGGFVNITGWVIEDQECRAR